MWQGGRVQGELTHDVVHDGIGGLMGDPDTAANDPIFWLHHANIDRLWNRWLQQNPGVNPDANSIWGQQAFTFMDENGNPVTQPAYRSLEYVTDNLIDYKYDAGDRGNLRYNAPHPGWTVGAAVCLADLRL